MTHAIHAMTPGEAVVMAAQLARTHGDIVSPRGMKTRELLAAELRIEQPWSVRSLTLELAGRNLNPAIGAIEALQLVGQTTVPDLLMDKVPAFRKFEDDGIFWGAYGQRVYGNLSAIVRTLKDDPDSRQAVLTIFDSNRDLHRNRKDIPCTIAIQFLIRRGELIARTMMRSNDIWLGLPYDLIQFCALQGAVAKALDLPMGPYLHTATSMHLYEKDFTRSFDMVDATTLSDYKPMWSGNSIGDISRIARDIITGIAYPSRNTRFELALFKAVHNG